MKRIPQTNPDEKALFETLNFFFDNFVSKTGIMTMFCKKSEGGIGYAHLAETLRTRVRSHDISHGYMPESGRHGILPQYALPFPDFSPE